MADLIWIGLPVEFRGSGGVGSGVSPWYAFPYTVRITRYVTTAPAAVITPQAATFYLRFVSDGNEIKQTLPQTLTLLLAPCDSVVVSGLGTCFVNDTQ